MPTKEDTSTSAFKIMESVTVMGRITPNMVKVTIAIRMTRALVMQWENHQLILCIALIKQLQNQTEHSFLDWRRKINPDEINVCCFEHLELRP